MDERLAWLMFSLVSFLGTLSVTEVVRVFAVRLRAVDHPGGRRVHRAPTARLGGLGIFWGFSGALVLATYGGAGWRAALHVPDAGLLGLLCGAGLMLILGVLDDIYGVPAVQKLAVQVVAALVLFGFGWRVETIGLPGLGAVPAGSLSLALTVAWVVFVTNALNLIDGLDGLAGGVALVAAVACALLLGPGGGAARLVAVALAGALAGFLWFNLSPALIFMGDAGSLFVGFVLAALTLRAGAASAPGAFPTVPMLLLAVPLLDTTEAIRRRVTAAARVSRSGFDFVREVRRRVFAPDGQHVHHRLVKGGLSTRRAVLVLWAIAASFALTGWLTLHWALVGVALATGFALTSWRGLGVLDRRLAPATAPLVVAGRAEAQAADDDEVRRAA